MHVFSPLCLKVGGLSTDLQLRGIDPTTPGSDAYIQNTAF